MRVTLIALTVTQSVPSIQEMGLVGTSKFGSYAAFSSSLFIGVDSRRDTRR